MGAGAFPDSLLCLRQPQRGPLLPDCPDQRTHQAVLHPAGVPAGNPLAGTFAEKAKRLEPLDPIQLLQFQEEQAEKLDVVAAAVEQALERTKANMEWLSLNKEQVMEWFSREVSPG